MKKMAFNPTISFDGVAIIGACICCALWFGALGQRVSAVEETVRNHTGILQTLASGQQLQSQNIAVLQSMIDDVRRDSLKKP